MVNRVVLVGRLTRDPELRKTPTGVSVASFTIAVDNVRKNPDGTRGACFLNCSVFREQGENLVKYCRKGSLVGVDGSLNQRNFVRQDGSKGSAIEVSVDSVTFLEPRNAAATVKSEDTVSFDDVPEANSGENLDSIDLPDDDLPF
ncbi:MAG: single-stranded DNA-binding protein [Bacilli bacterium]|nr:single-stranded DNA-binding protein [Bacilli bacterium]